MLASILQECHDTLPGWNLGCHKGIALVCWHATCLC